MLKIITTTFAFLFFCFYSISYSQTTIAVLPFENLSNDPELDWLSLGISETISTDLRNIKYDWIH